MARIWYPREKDLIYYNKYIIDNYRATKSERHALGADSRLKLKKAIQSARAKKGDVEDKALVLMRRINNLHPFDSGNRRSAHFAMNEMLYCNKNYLVAMKRDKQARIQKQIRDRCLNHKQIRRAYGI